MSTITVTDQTALDQALADNTITRIIIDSPTGVWLHINGSSSVVARGSSRVVARDSSRVVAWDSSSVVARGSSSVVARDSSRVVARDSSRVVAWGSSSVVARGSSSVEARDSSSVEARDSSRVVARDSSSVEARGSSSVVARGSAGVHAWDRSKVDAAAHTAVWLHRATATVHGGHLIDLTGLDLNDTTTWLDYHGVDVADDATVRLYKAVDHNLNAGHSYTLTNYPVGETVTAFDWRPDNDCGGGLHLSPTPAAAKNYYSSATRFLRCAVAVDALAVVEGDSSATPKAKARTLLVEAEVDVHGRVITPAAAQS